MTITLGYWAIRGQASWLRYLLEFAEADYEEKRYELTNGEEWFEKDKHSLGFAYPNLPYIIDGDTKMTQSMAIGMYIAKKYKLAGTGDDSVEVAMVHGAVSDLRTALMKIAFSGDDFETLKEEFVNTKAPAMLKNFEKALTQQKWVAGTDKPSYADFILFDTLEMLYLLSSSLKDKFAKLSAFVGRVNDLPQIAKYKKRGGSKSWLDTPFFPPSAKFGHSRP